MLGVVVGIGIGIGNIVVGSVGGGTTNATTVVAVAVVVATAAVVAATTTTTAYTSCPTTTAQTFGGLCVARRFVMKQNWIGTTCPSVLVDVFLEFQ